MKNSLFYRMVNAVLDVIYPKQCVCCNSIIDSSEEICENCLRNIERVDSAKRCLKCGLEKDKCQCGIYVYHFESAVAPFYNTGIARRGMYAFKFKRRSHYGKFFAFEMAKCVAAEYGDIKLDFISFVPISEKGLRKRGFDQSFVLAEKLSEILKIPLLKNALISKSSKGSQHILGKSERFERARKVFDINPDINSSLSGKNILLVDDIKTTGATLDECARRLLFAGASKVYCVTALITAMKSDEDKKKNQRKYNPQKVLKRFGSNLG